jgi:protein-tyrosine phosphatase
MNRHEPFVDIHCHLLPGVDDGAATLDDAIAMAKMAVADGIGTVVATPHQLGNHAENLGGNLRAAVVALQRHLDAHRAPLRVLPGADVRVEPDLVRKIRSGNVVTLADRRRHVLLELPHDVYLPIDRLLAELAAAGVVGILSHPERNRGIQQQPDLLHALVRQGCLLQVTAGSLMGVFGSQARETSEWLVEQGLVHFIATDAHNVSSRPPSMEKAFEKVAEMTSADVASTLCCRNPMRVAMGETVPAGLCLPAKSSWISWFTQSSRSKKTRNSRAA